MSDKFVGGIFPKPLTREEEVNLVQKYREGTPDERKQAKDVLVEHNLRLVAHITKKYNAKEVEDLISIGTIGLIKAVKSFNPERSPRFATYASRCIENEILMFLRTAKKYKGDISIHDPVGKDKEGNEVTYEDRLYSNEDSVDEIVSRSIECEKLRRMFLCALDNREREIISLRYGLIDGEEHPQREIAKYLNISRSYVSRIEKRALQKLQQKLEERPQKK
ncbi:RNA polymerase sigma factor [Clostridia bacterium]|nr:RNA polymerase sigma factor [Clostridia bacterium]